MKRVFCALAVLLVLSLTSNSFADPVVELPTTTVRVTIPLRLLSPATVTTDGGDVARLEAGDWLVPGERWQSLDLELQRLQTVETRLVAENRSLKQSLGSVSPAWYWIAGALVTGFSGGVAYDTIKGWL